MYMCTIMDLIESQKKKLSQMKLEGILKMHIKKIDDNNRDKKKILLEIYNCNYSSQRKFYNFLVPDDTSYEAKQKLWYRYAQSLVFDCLDKFQKSSKLHMYYSFLQLQNLKNMY